MSERVICQLKMLQICFLGSVLLFLVCKNPKLTVVQTICVVVKLNVLNEFLACFDLSLYLYVTVCLSMITNILS